MLKFSGVSLSLSPSDCVIYICYILCILADFLSSSSIGCWDGSAVEELQLWTCLFLTSALVVLCILRLHCLVHMHLGSLCLFGKKKKHIVALYLCYFIFYFLLDILPLNWYYLFSIWILVVLISLFLVFCLSEATWTFF